MDDSPLSITSSITGILTFVVAILAAIYIRYTTLMNGYTEMQSILDSVYTTIKETRDLSSGRQSWQDPEHIHMGHLLVELYSTELSILGQLMNVSGHQMDLIPENLSHDMPDVALREIVEEARLRTESIRPRGNSQFRSLISLIPSFNYPQPLIAPLRVIQFLTLFGTTPALMRWYRVRENVLESVRKRENIRSRLLFLQVSEANA
ncbi:hypothetical protein CEP51_010567 [Fusarium floridanum]|uniref:Uncharacterized protein n=1 Tax=Fusarium floridanum TaxID=1325733 RepID=A0A428RE07_9HYPO|nr:hypothetical protein CEP51_010567 [Fusarium floridanum]